MPLARQRLRAPAIRLPSVVVALLSLVGIMSPFSVKTSKYPIPASESTDHIQNRAQIAQISLKFKSVKSMQSVAFLFVVIILAMDDGFDYQKQRTTSSTTAEDKEIRWRIGQAKADRGRQDEHAIANQGNEKLAVDLFSSYARHYFFGASRLSAVSEATSMTRMFSS